MSPIRSVTVCLAFAAAAAPAAFGALAAHPAAPQGDPQATQAPEGALSFILDDGVPENEIGDAGQFIWINRFTPSPADFPFQLEEVQVLFGDNNVPVGGAIEIVIHEDTDGDGDPGTGSTFLASHTDTVQANDGTTFSTYALVPPVVIDGPGDFLVGVINRYGFEGNNDFPAQLDQTASQGRSWAASYLAGNVPAIPTYPADEQWGTIDSFGFPGNWIIRASGTRILFADVSIEKTGAVVGDQIVFTITVSNDGPDDATGVVVTDPLPPEVAYVSDDCGGADVPPWTWNVGTLTSGTSATCNVTTNVLVGAGEVSNTATVTASETDPVPGDESSTVVVGLGTLLDIPAAGGFGLALLVALLAGAGIFVLGRRG